MDTLVQELEDKFKKQTKLFAAFFEQVFTNLHKTNQIVSSLLLVLVTVSLISGIIFSYYLIKKHQWPFR